MNVSVAFLERAAAETGYRTAPLEKVIRLGEVARSIASHPLLGRVLALKGGTALNLCLGAEPTRLSVDLDYNYIGHADRDGMLEERPLVESAVEELTSRMGYRVQRPKAAFAGRKTYLTYPSASGPDDRIEVDLNFLFRMPIADTCERSLWQPGGLDRPVVTVVSTTELVIGKLLALLDRATPRDAWDTARLPAVASDEIADPMFRAQFIALAAILTHPLETYDRARLESRLTDRTITEHLGPMLSVATPPVAADLIRNAWAVVGPLVELAPQEQEYIAAVHRGAAPTNLLFPDHPELAERVAQHPAVQWKLVNVRQHRGA